MSADELNTYQEILGYIELIKQKPNKDNKYFYLDAESMHNKCFIVNGDKIKLLPSKYDELKENDEFFICVQYDEKRVQYYGFSYEIKDNELNRASEVEGEMKWSEIEDCIKCFFLVNIKELTTSKEPYVEARYGIKKEESKVRQTYPTNSIASSSFKERESFYEKLNSFIKDNRTIRALDHINKTFDKMSKEQKYSDLDMVLRMLPFDKLNPPMMFKILESTFDIDEKLKERKEFMLKTKNYLSKYKEPKFNDILKSLEK